MAIQHNNGKITGKVKNVVYKNRKGKQTLQGLPEKVRRTDATKLKALEFGVASRQAAILKALFASLFPYLDGNVNGRLTAAIHRCMQKSTEEFGNRLLQNSDLDPLVTFSFNQQAHIPDILLMEPNFLLRDNGSMRVSLPAFVPEMHLRFPKDADHQFRINLFAVSVHFLKDEMQIVEHLSYTDASNAGKKDLEWEIKRELPGGMLFILFSIDFLARSWVHRDIFTTDKTFMPSIILRAFHVSESLSRLSLKAGFPAGVGEIIPTSFDPDEHLQKIRRALNLE